VSEAGGSTTLRLVIFLLPLPEPLPVPHMATYSFVGEEHEALENAALVPVEDIDAVPEALVGRLGVSIRVWQHKADALAPMKEEAERVVHVVEAMLGPDEHRQLRERGEEEAADQDGSRGMERFNAWAEKKQNPPVKVVTAESTAQSGFDGFAPLQKPA